MWNTSDSIPELIQRTSAITSLTIDESLELLGTLIDKSFDEQNEPGFRAAIEFGESLEAGESTSEQRVVLYYFMSNAWTGLWCSTSRASSPWAWEDHGVEKQIVYLRRAISEPEFGTVQKEDVPRSLQI